MPIRVLLIDDSPVDREVALRGLRGLAIPPGPAEVVCAGSWTEATPHVDAGAVDLVLLDYHLPERTGLEILGELTQRSTDLPVIMLTGQGEISTAVATLREGAREYVPKSSDVGPALCLAVERVWERVRLERDLAAAQRQLAAYASELEQKVAARTAALRAQAAEIEQLYLRSEEAVRVKAEFIANVSHELRTPLNVIVGFSEILEDKIASDATPDVHDALRAVRTQADRLHQLVASLLTLRDVREGSEGVVISRFRLPALVDELRADALPIDLDRGVALAWTAPADPREVAGDREKIRAIAYHLLSNAIKFTPAGRVDVAVTATPDGGVRLTVSDTGIGLPPDARQKIFEDFRQLDGSSTRRYEGLGLGLGIVKRYTALLGGTIRVESAPGDGTTVTVELPGAPRPALVQRP